MINRFLKKYRKQGFSIVEIGVACTILLVFLIPIFTILSKGNSGTLHNRNEFAARQFASNIIAYCNIIPFNSPELNEGEDIFEKLKLNLNGNEYFKLSNNKQVNLKEVDESFMNLVKAKSVSIKDIIINEIPYKYKFVTVKIEWLEPGKTVNNSVEMTGLVTER